MAKRASAGQEKNVANDDDPIDLIRRRCIHVVCRRRRRRYASFVKLDVVWGVDDNAENAENAKNAETLNRSLGVEENQSMFCFNFATFIMKPLVRNVAELKAEIDKPQLN